MQEWEYRFLSVDAADGDITAQLNELGAQCWEVVAVNFTEITWVIKGESQTRPALDVLLKRPYTPR